MRAGRTVGNGQAPRLGACTADRPAAAACTGAAAFSSPGATGSAYALAPVLEKLPLPRLEQR